MYYCCYEGGLSTHQVSVCVFTYFPQSFTKEHLLTTALEADMD